MNFMIYQHLILIGFFSILAWLILAGLGSTLMPILVAWVLAFLCAPLMARLEKKGIGRTVSTVGVFLFVTLFWCTALFFIIPKIVTEVRDFLPEFAVKLEGTLNKLETFLLGWGINLSLEKNHILELYEKYSTEILMSSVKTLGEFFKNYYKNIVDSTWAILNFSLTPLFSFFFIKDYEIIVAKIKKLVPRRYTSDSQKFFKKTSDVFGAYFKGQILVGISLGIIYALGLSICGVPFGFLIGILSGPLNIIPYIGTTVGLVLSLTVSLADLQWFPVIGTLITFGVAQFIEGWFLTPKIVGNKLGLSFLQTIISTLIGVKLFGIMGVVFSIPTAAMIKYTLEVLLKKYQASSFYE